MAPKRDKKGRQKGEPVTIVSRMSPPSTQQLRRLLYPFEGAFLQKETPPPSPPVLDVPLTLPLWTSPPRLSPKLLRPTLLRPTLLRPPADASTSSSPEIPLQPALLRSTLCRSPPKLPADPPPPTNAALASAPAATTATIAGRRKISAARKKIRNKRQHEKQRAKRKLYKLITKLERRLFFASSSFDAAPADITPAPAKE